MMKSNKKQLIKK